MDLRYSDADRAFRAEIRDWLDDQLSGEWGALRGLGGPGRDHEAIDERLAWNRHLAAHGWTCVGWPTEHGGRGLSLWQQAIFHEEYARSNAPAGVNHLGEDLFGPALIPFGTPGADVQAQAMVQALVNLRVFGMTPQEAVEAPRAALYGYPQSFEPHESGADVLRVESRVPAETRGALADRGHTIENWPDLVWKAGAVCLIEADSRTGTLGGAADPRRPCAAMGF